MGGSQHEPQHKATRKSAQPDWGARSWLALGCPLIIAHSPCLSSLYFFLIVFEVVSLDLRICV